VPGQHPYARSLAVWDGLMWRERVVAQLGSSSGGEENGTDMRARISAARMREGSLRGIRKF
jgi:hypothetical protein